jgi:DNA repair exonuclease SbcCD ATPase subunit
MNSSINNNNINISIYSNAVNNNNNNNLNSPMGNLYNKIKKEIKQMNTEIKTEKEKYEKIKKSLYLTKMNELSVESALLEEQINKISSFITKAFVIQEENLKKRQEYINLRDNIEKQEKIIKNLTEKANILDKEEVRMTEELEKGKKKLVLKSQKIKINKKKLKILKERNNNLFKNINDINQPYVVKIDHSPIEIKSYFTGKISQLNKLINFFNHQNKYYVQEMNKLKDRHQKLVNEDKKKDNKLEEKQPDTFSSRSIVSENEKLEHLSMVYKEKVAEEKELEKKFLNNI